MSKNLSICMVSDDFLPAATGVGTHLKVVAPELARRGHKVSVVTTRRKGEPETEQWEGVTVYRVFTVKAFGFYQALPSIGALRAIIDRVKPDLVHHHYIGYMLLRVLGEAERKDLPNIYTYHMTEDHLTQPMPLRVFRGIVARWIVRFCNRMDYIITVSGNLVAELPKKGIRIRASFITNPVVFKDGSGVEPARRTDAFTVMYAGRLGLEKNVAYLIRAFADLSKTLPQSVLWIAGRGPEAATLQGLCEELGVSDRVQFLGFLDHAELARYFRSCDVFVLPSLIETQGLVAMEAMRFSRPVIVTRAIISADELVEHGINGYIVDPDSIADLSRRLGELATTPALRDSMGQASCERAKGFDPELVVDAMEAVYADTLKGRRLG
jgi:1,2-diacylglycerol 3-alpha-glucosyltransferase